MLEVDGTVFDDRNRLRIALHRHHDVEPGGAHGPDLGLGLHIADLDDGVRKSDFGHPFVQFVEFFSQRPLVVAAEFDQENRARLAADEARDRRREGRILARKIEHRSIDQFDRHGVGLHEFLRRGHRVVEARKMTDPQDPQPRQLLQRKFDAREERERPLRADEQMGRVERAGRDCVEIVPADAA